MKKLVALMCALALLVGCVSFAGAEELAEVTYWHGEIARNAVATFGETVWFQKMNEIFAQDGFQIKIVGPAQGADNNTAVNAMLTSGQYPDMLSFNFDTQYTGGRMAAVEDGVIWDYSKDPEAPEKMKNWYKGINEYDRIRKSVILDDGSMVTFGMYDVDARRGAYWGYAIRTDWLDRLGLAIPETLEDFEKVLYAFRDQDANGNGDPNDEIPLVGCNWVQNNNFYFLVYSLAAIWGCKVNQIYRNPQTGDMTYCTEYNGGENYKQYVATMAKWIADGVLDKEFVSQNNDARIAKITSDKAGCFFCFPDNVQELEDALKLNLKESGYADPEKAQIYGLVPIKGPDGVPYNYDWDSALVLGGATTNDVITTAAVENGHLDYCYRFIDFMFSDEGCDLVNWGVEGVTYEVAEDGSKHYTDLIWNDPDYGPADAIFKYAYPTMGDWPRIMSYEAWGAMNLNSDDQKIAHVNYGLGSADLDLPKFTLNQEERDAYTAVITDINTAVSEATIKIMLGQQPIETLDAVIQQVKGMGIDQAIGAYQSAYERYQDK